MVPMRAETEAAAGAGAPMRPRPFKVTEAQRELADVVSLRLSALDDEPVPFEAGQFNMLYAFGVGEVAISISGDPSQPGDLLHTIRDVGAVSGALARTEPGATIGVRGPFGTSWPVASERGRHLLFVAGGLGLAPLRPAIYRALASRRLYSGITLVLGARSPRDLLYSYQLAGWASGQALNLFITVDHAGREWTGAVGVVTTQFAAALRDVDPASVSAFVCGPEVMMRHSCAALYHLGVGSERMWISMERNMECAIGLCGHCQFGPDFVCRDGPVFRHDRVASRLGTREV
jgi:NAD(P)H-flavin reductase